MIVIKFDIESEAFYMHDNKVHSSKISHIKIDISKNKTAIQYSFENGMILDEDKMYSTKEELLQTL